MKFVSYTIYLLDCNLKQNFFQEAYETAVHQLFGALEKLEKILETSRFLIGSRFTEADVRLFTTLIRYDTNERNIQRY